jgi:hypothetical protein
MNNNYLKSKNTKLSQEKLTSEFFRKLSFNYPTMRGDDDSDT